MAGNEGARLTAGAPSFRAHGSRRLRKLGAPGCGVRVTLEDGWIALTGEDGPPVRQPVGTVQRMRTGFDEGKGGPFYQTPAVARRRAAAPADAAARGPGAYARFVRALAPQVAASHGVAAIERGTSMFAALNLPIAIGLLFAAAIGVGVFALADEPTPLRWLPALLPGLFFAFLVWRFQTLHRPRRVADLGELERQLPG